MMLVPAVLHSALKAGVREFVVCAGARDSALIVALATLESRGIKLWQHFEERCAGFFALGRSLQSRRPVAIVTTSGTAVAELLPAIIEAHYQAISLLVLSADRPRHYRGSGAPQCILQPGIFGPHVVACHDLESPDTVPALDLSSGPVHVNVCLPDPSVIDFPAIRASAGLMTWSVQNAPVPPPSTAASMGALSAHRLVLCGQIFPEHRAAALAAMLQFGGLVYAEAASGLRHHTALQDRMLRCGDLSLNDLPVQEVLRLGGVPACRFWRDLEQRTEIAVTSWSPSGYTGLARRSQLCRELPRLTFSAPTVHLDPAPLMASELQRQEKMRSLLARFPESEPRLVHDLSRAISRDATVFVGNSLAVREWNLCAVAQPVPEVYTLRGVNGIDGNLSAYLGLAAGAEESWCLTGDLTTLYDLSAPWVLGQLPPGMRRFVVMNNSGGKIFSRLPALCGLTARERELMENPHTLDFQAWARMWGLDYLTGGSSILRDPRELASLSPHAVIELRPDPQQTEQFWEQWAKM